MSGEAMRGLTIDGLGRLLWSAGDGDAAVTVTPIRAFPLSAPDDGVALVGADGHERHWIDSLAAVAEPARGWILGELAARDFAPVIQRIVTIRSYVLPSTWLVETDRGPSELVLRGEEGIRRLADGGLLITDERGVGFRVPDLAALDPQSRRMLDRFL